MPISSCFGTYPREALVHSIGLIHPLRRIRRIFFHRISYGSCQKYVVLSLLALVSLGKETPQLWNDTRELWNETRKLWNETPQLGKETPQLGNEAWNLRGDTRPATLKEFLQSQEIYIIFLQRIEKKLQLGMRAWVKSGSRKLVLSRAC